MYYNYTYYMRTCTNACSNFARINKLLKNWLNFSVFTFPETVLREVVVAAVTPSTANCSHMPAPFTRPCGLRWLQRWHKICMWSCSSVGLHRQLSHAHRRVQGTWAIFVPSQSGKFTDCSRTSLHYQTYQPMSPTKIFTTFETGEVINSSSFPCSYILLSWQNS